MVLEDVDERGVLGIYFLAWAAGVRSLSSSSDVVSSSLDISSSQLASSSSRRRDVMLLAALDETP